MGDLPADTTLSHYRIVSRLGAGGMGEVYLAQDTSLDRKVALKVLPPELAANQDRMRRFVREAKAAAALNHPNVAHIYEIGEHAGTHFIAMELVDGRTLREEIYRDRADLAGLLRLLHQAAEGLARAHAAGVIHRDLKPDNVMVTRDGHAKVLDFGLAKLVEQPAPGVDVSDVATAMMPQRSAPGTVMGTVGYMSPEQAQGKIDEIDQRSDVFSFGCMLFEAATRRRPFEGESAIMTLHRLVYEPPPPIADFNPSAPPDLQRIVRRCLAKDPEERYQTMKDVAIELKELRRELESGGLGRAAGPTDGSEPAEDRGAAAPGEVDGPTTGAPPSSLPPRASSAEYLVASIGRHKLAAVVLFAVLVVAAVGLGLYWRGRGAEGAIRSIAVMPFVNEGGDAEAEYLSDGMTETLISSLSQLPHFSVKPRSTVFRYKGREVDPQTVAKELGVQAILIGRVAGRQRDVSLYVELVDVSSDKVVWSQRYSRSRNELVTLQADIARDVSNRLKTDLSLADEAKVTKAYTENPDAYELYLKGRYQYSKYNESSYKKAIDYYTQALEMDPRYSLAYLGIAEAYQNASDYYMDPNEAEPKVKVAVDKALELDDTLAEAHYTRAMVAFWYDWDWATVERECRRAGELDASYPIYPPYLSAMGRHEEAIRAAEARLRSVPLDLLASTDLQGMYQYAGRYDEAIEQARKSIELDQSNWGSYQWLGLAYERKKRYPEAIAALEKAASLDDNPSILGYLGYVYAAAGRTADAERVLGELTELSERRYVPAYSIAIVYAGLNEKDKAFELLDKAYDQRSYFMTLLGVDPLLENLRPDPRFKAMLKRLNLPE
jgi:TolB-like protein/tRNA A-37 threonylcarbamoyl transferase component Bud32